MNILLKIAAAGLGALSVAACVEDSTARQDSGMREASSAAETACMTAVNSQYGGNVSRIDVLSSEFSEANSQVSLAAVGVRGTSTTEKFRCLVSNDGQVQELQAISY